MGSLFIVESKTQEWELKEGKGREKQAVKYSVKSTRALQKNPATLWVGQPSSLPNCVAGKMDVFEVEASAIKS